jgi:hypothetical protein
MEGVVYAKDYREEMNPDVIKVEPKDDYTLHVWFENGVEGIFDVKPYLDCGVFQPLKDPKMFNTVKPFLGAIQWANEADLCRDTVYPESKKLNIKDRLKYDYSSVPLSSVAEPTN